MPEQDRPTRAAGKDKAEGERWRSEPDTIGKADRDENPERLYRDEDADDAGGITNRPLADEVGSQESLPDRGTARRGGRNPNATRPEGDHTGSER